MHVFFIIFITLCQKQRKVNEWTQTFDPFC